VPHASPALIAIYYGALAASRFASASWSGRWRRVSIAAASMALALLVSSPFTAAQGPAEGRLRITLLDVGQGDAILLQFPGRDALLVDAGGSPGDFDIGGRVVAPAVWALGATRLRWFAITHGDRDHLGGAPGVIEDLAPGEFWEGVPVPPHAELQRLRDRARVARAAWRSVFTGTRVEIAGVTIEAIHPPEPDWERQRVRNDDSLVLRVRYGDVEVLLTGDAGAEFEHRLPSDLDAAPIRILKAGHHGSRTSTSDALVERMRPHIALISAGRANLFGHPAPDVVARLEAGGAAVFRTDRDGAVSVETDGRVVWIRTPLGRDWRLLASGAP
jgi:competence protein ComEC